MLTLTCLGPMVLMADGAVRPLPASRKTRALLAYLALEPRRHRREGLCELLWEVPDDPRAALRWSLAKLRPALDRPDRLQAGREDVALDGDGLTIDVATVRAAVAAGPDRTGTATLAEAFRAACGRFLADCDLPAQPLFQNWIIAIRHEMQLAARQLGEALLARPLPPAERVAVLDALVAADPHDATLHARRIAVLGLDGQEAAAARAVALRLLAEVEDDAAGALARAGAALAPDQAADLPAGVLARVAVQPFAGSGHAVLAPLLAEVITDGVAGSLSRFASLNVVRGGAAGAYAVNGTVLLAAGRARVRYRLSDADGTQLWAGEVDAAGDDLIALEEAIATAIVAVLEPRIRYSEVARARGRAAGGADDLFLKALGHMAGDGDFAAVVTLLERALAVDADHGLAGAFLPWAALQTGRIDGPAAAGQYAGLARRAVHAAPDDVMVQAVGGLMLVLLAHDFDGGLAVIDRAVRLQPQSMFGWMTRGWAKVHGGDSTGALADFDRAETLSPADPTDNSINAGRAIACFQTGDLVAASRWVQRALALGNASLEAMRVGIAVAIEAGRADEARALAAALLARNPAEQARRALLLPFRKAGTARRLHDAYVAAGIPE